MKHLVIALVLAACGPTDDGKATTATTPTALTTPPAAAIPEAVRRTICEAEPCGDATSSITVYRDASGAVKKLYRLYGACSHNPGMYFDPFGTNTETIPEQPIVPGSDEAKAIAAKHDAQVGGLTKAESIGCR